MSKALITGATGQDGWYLTELLASKGYEVHAFVRRTSKAHRVHPATHKIHSGSLEDYASIFNAIFNSRPDEVYHLAAQSFVKESFDDPGTTLQVNILGTQRVFEAVRQILPKTKIYFAGSSEVFGNTCAPQSELTAMQPCSPYGISKAAGIQLARVYRRSYGMFVACGIAFNHESPRRGKEFVTMKIIDGVRKIAAGEANTLVLGNLDAVRDWGHAKDYVYAMWLMLQHSTPDDFVIATGKSHSVRDFCREAFALIGEDYRNWCTTDKQYTRPTDVQFLQGIPAKAKALLGWEPKIQFSELVRDMYKHADYN